MMTHGNVLATISAVMTIVPGLGSKDVYLAYLPLAHILELAAEVWFLSLSAPQYTGPACNIFLKEVPSYIYM